MGITIIGPTTTAFSSVPAVKVGNRPLCFSAKVTLRGSCGLQEAEQAEQAEFQQLAHRKARKENRVRITGLGRILHGKSSLAMKPETAWKSGKLE